jgi:SAM-dependent methyltransferase
MTDRDLPPASQATLRLREYWNDRAARERTDGERIELSKRTQRARFGVFLRTVEAGRRSVLDVGCGVGDFWEYLREHDINCEYLGVDLSEQMINRASARFPEARFEVRDVLAWNPGRRFDYTVAFAIHNVRVTGAGDLLEQTLRRQFEWCDRAAHMSILTDRYRGYDAHILAWRAEEILTMALAITPFVSLQHHYLPHDFCVTLYRDALIDTDSTLAG